MLWKCHYLKWLFIDFYKEIILFVYYNSDLIRINNKWVEYEMYKNDYMIDILLLTACWITPLGFDAAT